MVRFELPGSCPDRPLYFRLRLLEEDDEDEERKHTPELHNEHHGGDDDDEDDDDELAAPSYTSPASLLGFTAARPGVRRRRVFTTYREMRADHFRAAKVRRICIRTNAAAAAAATAHRRRHIDSDC